MNDIIKQRMIWPVLRSLSSNTIASIQMHFFCLFNGIKVNPHKHTYKCNCVHSIIQHPYQLYVTLFVLSLVLNRFSFHFNGKHYVFAVQDVFDCSNNSNNHSDSRDRILYNSNNNTSEIRTKQNVKVEKNVTSKPKPIHIEYRLAQICT